MLGNHLRSLRKRRGLRMPQVVAATGYPRRSLYGYEADEALPPPHKLGRLLDLYQATVGERWLAYEAYTSEPPKPEVTS